MIESMKEGQRTEQESSGLRSGTDQGSSGLRSKVPPPPPAVFSRLSTETLVDLAQGLANRVQDGGILSEPTLQQPQGSPLTPV